MTEKYLSCAQMIPDRGTGESPGLMANPSRSLLCPQVPHPCGCSAWGSALTCLWNRLPFASSSLVSPGSSPSRTLRPASFLSSSLLSPHLYHGTRGPSQPSFPPSVQYTLQALTALRCWVLLTPLCLSFLLGKFPLIHQLLCQFHVPRGDFPNVSSSLPLVMCRLISCILF